MKPSRENKPHSPTESLSKSLSTGYLISGLITFVAMFYPLYKARPENAGADYYLPYCLGYGIFCLAILIYGLVSFSLIIKWARFLKINAIVGMVIGVLVVLASLPIGICIKSIQFMISLMVIGVCVFAIAFLTLRSYLDEFKH